MENSQFNDIFKMATSMMGGFIDEEHLSVVNNPEFISMMNSVTKDILQKFDPTKKVSSRQETPSIENGEVQEYKERTRDLHFDIEVTLEELYNGKTKKINVKRKRTYTQSDGSYKIVEEKKTLTVDIHKGMKHEEQIVFKEEADQLPGFITGDVIINIKELEHPVFYRCENDLYVYKNISISEIYYFNTQIVHLDNTVLYLENVSGDILTHFNLIRKIPSRGMPKNDTEYGDLFVRFFVIMPDVSPDKEHLYALFPPLNSACKDREDEPTLLLEYLNDDDYSKVEMFEDNGVYEENNNSSSSVTTEEDDTDDEDDEDDDSDNDF